MTPLVNRIRAFVIARPLAVRLVLLTVLLGGFLLRIHHIYVSGLWFDEVASYFIASKGWLGILDYARLAPGEHPPTFYWPFLFWMNVAGTSEFVLRYYSLWFGVLFLPLLYRFARRHFAPRLQLHCLARAEGEHDLVQVQREPRRQPRRPSLPRRLDHLGDAAREIHAVRAARLPDELGALHQRHRNEASVEMTDRAMSGTLRSTTTTA